MTFRVRDRASRAGKLWRMGFFRHRSSSNSGGDGKTLQEDGGGGRPDIRNHNFQGRRRVQSDVTHSASSGL